MTGVQTCALPIFRLQPENAALEPIYADHVRILGRVVGVFREL